MVCFSKNSAIFSPKALDNSKSCINTHNSLVNNHLRGLNTLCDFPARVGEALFLCSLSNAQFTMHNAQW